MMKKKIPALIFVFLAVFVCVSAVLLQKNAVLTLQYSTEQPVSLEIYTNKFLSSRFAERADRRIELPDTNGESRTLELEIPVPAFQRIQIVFPEKGRSFMLNGITSRAFGVIRNTAAPEKIRKAARLKNLSLATKPAGIVLTAEQDGASFHFRYTNDLLRILPMMIGALAGAAAVLLSLSFCSAKFRKAFSSKNPLWLIVIFVLIFFGPSGLIGIYFSQQCRNSTPEFTDSPTKRYLTAFENSYEYGKSLRNTVLSKYCRFAYKNRIRIFPRVAYGKDGWLFYRAPEAEDTVLSHFGEVRVTEQQLQTVCDTIKEIHNSLKDRNIPFYFFMPPNKADIYSEFLQTDLPPVKPSLTETVCNHLRKNIPDLALITPDQALLDAKKKFSVPLYLKRDTHWNKLGAYVAARMLVEQIAPESLHLLPPPEKLVLLDTPEQVDGDLCRMAGVQDPEDDFTADAIEKMYAAAPERKDSVKNIFRGGNPQGKRILIIHDSFFYAMYPYLVQVASEIMCVRFGYFTYNVKDVDEFKPDIIVMESVARLMCLRFNDMDIEKRNLIRAGLMPQP